jgi:hypothetical protein
MFCIDHVPEQSQCGDKGINGIGKCSRYSKLLLALGIPKITEINKRNSASLYSRIFKYDSPARQFNMELLTKCLTTVQRVKGTILDRVLDLSLSPAGIVLDRVPRVKLGGRAMAQTVYLTRSSTCSIATRRLPHPWVRLTPHGMPDAES